MERNVEFQNTHIVLFKSPRDVLQINTFSQQLGLGSQLKEWYHDATCIPFGHLLIDLTPITVPKKNKMEQKREKEEIVLKDFDSIYSAVNAKLETSSNKHLLDLILNSPRIRLSQSKNIILDNRDTKEPIVDFVCALKRKNTDFTDIYFIILKATENST